MLPTPPPDSAGPSSGSWPGFEDAGAARPPLPGTRYQGSGSPEAAVRGVEEAAQSLSMIVSSINRSPDLVLIETVQPAPWYRVLLLALPQRGHWRVEQVEGRLIVTSDFRLFTWYRVLLVGLWVLVGVILLAATLGREPDGPRAAWQNAFMTLGLLAVVVVALAVTRHLLGALGGRRLAVAWHQVLARVEADGGPFQPSQGVSRYSRAMIGFATCMLAVAVWVMAQAPRPPVSATDGIAFYLLGGLATFLLMLIALVWLLPGRAAFNLRVSLVLPGVGSAFAVLSLALLSGPWLLAGKAAGEIRQAVVVRPALFAVDGPDLVERGWAKERAARLRDVAWLLISFTGVIVAVGAGLCATALDSALAARLQLERLRAFRGRGVYREATRGGRPLRLIRLVFGVLWSALAAVLLAALAFAVLCGVDAVVPLFDHPRLQVPELSALMVAVALGRPVGDPWTEVTVRALWVLYGLGALALLAASVGQLALDRRRTRRALRRVVELGEEAWPGLLECSPDLGQVRLVAAPDVPLRAEAHAFGLRQRERYVAVSPRLLAGLEPEERRALLAHELAHHRLGHCRLVALARWLGRLTFVGDGFVTALLDSAGLETEADDEARKRFGVPDPVLESCIRKVVEPAEHEPASPSHPAPRLRPEHAAVGYTDPGLPRATRWRHARHLFIQQFTGASSLPYWHPAAEDRLAALQVGRSSR